MTKPLKMWFEFVLMVSGSLTCIPKCAEAALGSQKAFHLAHIPKEHGILLNPSCGTSLCPHCSTHQGPMHEMLVPVTICMLSWSVSNFRCPGLTLGEVVSHWASWLLLLFLLHSVLFFSIHHHPREAGFNFSLHFYSGFLFGCFPFILQKQTNKQTTEPYFLFSKLAPRRCSSNPATSPEIRWSGILFYISVVFPMVSGSGRKANLDISIRLLEAILHCL